VREGALVLDSEGNDVGKVTSGGFSPSLERPIAIAYVPRELEPSAAPGALRFLPFEGGLIDVGHDATSAAGFAFDNESPRHRRFVQPFALANRRDPTDVIFDDGFEIAVP
jgi:glycine cleavage system aminomethyltransferase T